MARYGALVALRPALSKLVRLDYHGQALAAASEPRAVRAMILGRRRLALFHCPPKSTDSVLSIGSGGRP